MDSKISLSVSTWTYFEIRQNFASCDDSVVLSIAIFSLVNLIVCRSIMSKLISFFLITVNTKQLCYAWLGKMKCLSLVLMTKLLYCMIYEVSFISLQKYSSVGSYEVQRFDCPKKTIF